MGTGLRKNLLNFLSHPPVGPDARLLEAFLTLQEGIFSTLSLVSLKITDRILIKVLSQI